jgi:hypothetical protein
MLLIHPRREKERERGREREVNTQRDKEKRYEGEVWTGEVGYVTEGSCKNVYYDVSCIENI